MKNLISLIRTKKLRIQFIQQRTMLQLMNFTPNKPHLFQTVNAEKKNINSKIFNPAMK